METSTATIESPPPSTDDATPSDNLKASDRCDSCGAQAYVSALIHGSELLFCGHHYTAAEAKLAQIEATIVDERYKLAVKHG